MKKVYIVAEISQNHNGDIDIAKDLIEYARLAGCDGVKLNKRHIPHELTKEAMLRPYNSPNAFAQTYGMHREFLEFNEEQHRELKKYAENRDLDYLLSVCDIPSLDFALSLNPKFIKIPSKEITNIPLLAEIAKYRIDVVFSIGLGTEEEIKTALRILRERNPTVVICTSQYPTELDNINLNRIKSFKGYKVGFSAHVPDPMLGIAAVAMGAEYIEYHITMDRKMMGSDQKVALELEELVYVVDCIRDLQIALGNDKCFKILPKYLESTKKKLMKEECEDGIWRIP